MELVTHFVSLHICALFIKLMDEFETLGCVLKVTCPEKKLYWPIGLIPQRSILASAFGCTLQS